MEEFQVLKLEANSSLREVYIITILVVTQEQSSMHL